jgi:hypothetical protein
MHALAPAPVSARRLRVALLTACLAAAPAVVQAYTLEQLLKMPLERLLRLEITPAARGGSHGR